MLGLVDRRQIDDLAFYLRFRAIDSEGADDIARNRCFTVQIVEGVGSCRPWTVMAERDGSGDFSAHPVNDLLRLLGANDSIFDQELREVLHRITMLHPLVNLFFAAIGIGDEEHLGMLTKTVSLALDKGRAFTGTGAL